MATISSVSSKLFQTILQNWKVPKVWRKKKKPKTFTFTLSGEDLKRAADAGYSIAHYIYAKRQRNRWVSRPKIKKLEEIKEIIKLLD